MAQGIAIGSRVREVIVMKVLKINDQPGLVSHTPLTLNLATITAVLFQVWTLCRAHVRTQLLGMLLLLLLLL